ncbi:MAG: hypothetical protein C4326_05395 [Ignavibacteria bacterium]
MRGVHILFLLCLWGAVSHAQEPSLEASVDKNPVAIDDQFTLSFVLTNAGMSGGKNLKLPNLEKFHVMMGPSTSTSMQIINGAVSSSVTYSYVLQPKEIGTFTIGSASIDIGNKTYTSAPITIEVVKGSPQANQPKGRQGVSGDLDAQLSENLFLRASVDKTRALQGEQIILTFKLYTRVAVQNYNLNKTPTMTGFWSEDIEMPKQVQLTTETVNGKQYQVGVIKRMALFPTQPGTLEIGPMEITTLVTVRDRRSWDPFDAFFSDPFGRQIEYVVKSEPLRIKVDPLPVGAPVSFKGAVGRFTLNVKADRLEAKTNEPISVKVTIAGTGNIKVLESPAIEFPKDFEQYTPKVSDAINRREGKINGSKTFEYILIPRYPGKKVIKPVEFSYFDLGKREYITLRSDEIAFIIEQGAPAAAPFVAATPRTDVQLLSQDVRFIKLSKPAFRRRGEFLHTSPVFVALTLLPLAGIAGVFVYTRRRQEEMRDVVGYRTRQAIKVAKRGLKAAEALLKEILSGKDGSSEKKLQFYAEVAKALWKYVGDKFNIQQADLSIETAVNELHKRAVDGEIAASLRSVLELCEMARFAPTSLSLDTLQKTYDDANKIIVDLERTLKKS